LVPVGRTVAMRYWEHVLEDTIVFSFEHTEQKNDASVADRQGLGVGGESRD
jgi:hypothetical protein